MQKHDCDSTPGEFAKSNDIDFVVFRENTEGLYVGMGGIFKKGTPDEIATQLFRRLLVRAPDRQELEEILQFYDSVSDKEQAWALVARALINTDEAITTP